MKRSLIPAQARSAVSDFWAARDARERTILSVGMLVVLLALFYVIALAPALAGRERLARALPEMRQQVAQLQAMAREAGALKPAKPSGASMPLTREGLEASLGEKGLKAQGIVLTGENTRVTLPSASFSLLTSWIDDAQKNLAVQVVDANIVALSQPDTVSATLTLRQQKAQ